MKVSSLQKTMKKERSKSCKEIVSTKDDSIVVPSSSPLPYFIKISIPRRKIRIKLPKVLVQTMRRRNPKCSSDNTDNSSQFKNKKKWTKPRNKIGSFISNAFGKKNSQSFRSNADNVHSNGEALKKCEEDNNESSKADSLRCENDKFQTAPSPESTKFRAHSFKELIKIEDEATKDERFDDKKMSQLLDLKVPLSFSGFICKKIGFSSINRDVKKTSNCNGNSSRRLSSNRKELMRNKVTEESLGVEDKGRGEEERDDEELCKKRILMGEKCRPLNVSGALHYDENGILLPEEVLPFEEW